MVESRREMGMPGVEFEGPLGMFWTMDEVPFEALTNGIAEIVKELHQRGYRDDMILEAVKAHGELLRIES